MTRLEELRKQNKYSQRELANRIYVNQSAVSQWERGVTMPSSSMLLKLSELYGVSVDYLLGKDDDPGERTSVTPPASKIPVLGSIPAGIPVEAVEEILDWEDIPPEWTTGGREYFGLKVRGDSMYPKYLDGDTVILRKQTHCDSGDDCAVMVNGNDSTLKQVLRHEDGSLEIRPINPNYSPRTFTPEEVGVLPVTIAGVVVELRRKIK